MTRLESERTSKCGWARFTLLASSDNQLLLKIKRPLVNNSWEYLYTPGASVACGKVPDNFCFDK